MHVRSCCFARIKHIVFFYVLVAVRVVLYLIVRSQLITLYFLNCGRGVEWLLDLILSQKILRKPV